MESRGELLGELALISRQLQASDEPTSDLIDALADAARALKVPIHEHRDDAHCFIEGTESVESATWTQCGGLVHALSHKHVVDDRRFAARVAQRISDLLPNHR